MAVHERIRSATLELYNDVTWPEISCALAITDTIKLMLPLRARHRRPGSCALINCVNLRILCEIENEFSLLRWRYGCTLSGLGYPFIGADIGTRIKYDALGRVVRRTNPDDTYQQMTYGAGTVAIANENGRSTTHNTQAFGDPDETRLASLADAKSNTWTYTYNALGDLKTVVAPDGVTRTWDYDNRNLLRTETQPESGVTTYSYDAAGVLKSKNDARGTGFVYTYDGNDRPITIVAGNQWTTITYEPGSDRRRVVSVDGIATTLSYDGAGRLAKRDTVIDGQPFVSGYEYDGNDNVAAITYPSGRRVVFGIDTANRITDVTDESFHRPIATYFVYHPSGAVTSYVSGNGIVNQMAYDSLRYWPRSVTAGTNGLSLTYDPYDGVGNVFGIGDSRADRGPVVLEYDELDRLTRVTAPYGPESYAYDVHGNRAPSGGMSYQYDPATLRLMNKGGMPFLYDNNGNLIAERDLWLYAHEPVAPGDTHGRRH